MLLLAAAFIFLFFGGSVTAQQRHYTSPKTNKTFTISSLTINGDITLAFDDLKSVLPKSHQGGIKSNYAKGENYIYLDSTLNWNNGDPGVRLINNLVNSQHRYEYRVADTVTTELRSNKTGKRLKYVASPFMKTYLNKPVSDKNNQLMNAVVTIKRPDLPDNFYYSPLNGLTGQVTLAVSLDSLYTDSTRTMLKERPSLVFHELWECFLRGDSLYDYRKAHARAVEIETGLPKSELGGRKSKDPGKGYPSSKGLVIKKIQGVSNDPKKVIKNSQPKNNAPIKKST